MTQASRYLLGRIAAMLVGAVSFPLYTRLLDVKDYGQLTLVLKLVLIATVFAKSGIQNAVMRFYEENAIAADRGCLRSYMSTAITGGSALAAFVTGLFLSAVWLLPAGAIDPTLRLLLLAASGLIFVRTLQSIALAFYRMEGRTGLYNLVDVGTKALSVSLAVMLLVGWKLGAYGIVCGVLGAEALAISLFLGSLWRRGLLRAKAFDASRFQELFAYGFPLIAYELASLLHDAAGRFVIQFHLGSEQLGYFAAAYTVGQYIEEFFVAPIAMALSPMFLKLWVSHGEERTRKFVGESLNWFVLGALCIAAGSFAASKDILTLVASRKYANAHPLIPIIVTALLIYATHIFLSTALYVHKLSKTAAYIVGAACVVNIALNLVLVPHAGLYGAAMATLAGYSLQVVLVARVAQPLLPIDFPVGRWLGAAAVAAACAYVAWQVDVHSSIGNCFVKAAVLVPAYAVGLAVINPPFRRLVFEQGVAWARRRFKEEVR